MKNTLFDELKEIDEKIVKIENDLIKTTHSKKTVRFIDRTILIASIIGPAMTLPQVWQIFSTKDAQGVSALTWTAYLFLAVIWLIYGIAHKDRAVIINNLLWFIFELMVLIGALLYG